MKTVAGGTKYLVGAALALACCSCARDVPPSAVYGGRPTIALTSTAFKANGPLPTRFTCDGDDISPPLAWSNAPAGVKSWVVICDDSDAPGGAFTHWLCFNLPASQRSLATGKATASGGKQGTNDFQKLGYSGACPPSGAHRYYFRVYALDTLINVPDPANRYQLHSAMVEHVLGYGELMAHYSRPATNR